MLSIQKISTGVFLGAMAISAPSWADDSAEHAYPHVDAETAHCSAPTSKQKSIVRGFCYQFSGFKRVFDTATAACERRSDDKETLKDCFKDRDDRYLDSVNSYLERAKYTIRTIEGEKPTQRSPLTPCVNIGCSPDQ